MNLAESAIDDLEQAARESLRLTTIDPGQAQALAQRIKHTALRTHDWRPLSISEHALGLAAKQLDDLMGSTTALRRAIRAGQRAESDVLVAEARASLAGTLISRGRLVPALSEIAAALGQLEGVAAAKVQTQQAAILQMSGRNDEALAVLRVSLPVLRRSGEHDWATRALSNRSLLHINRRAFRLAEADLLAARQLCDDHSLATWGAYVEQNLGWLDSSRGDVIAALGHYDRAEQRYRKLGTEVGSLLEARGRLLLSVRLVDEARAAAETAIQLHGRQQRNLELVDAQLLLSTVAMVQGDGSTAVAAAAQAARGYRTLHRADGAALARYARLQATYLLDAGAVTPAQARRCADELARFGWLVPSLEARILAGVLALSRGQRKQARADLAEAARARSIGPADLRARAWLAEALLRRADGRRRAAKTAIWAGLRIVERYQATLGATELRAHVSIHRGALAHEGLRVSIEEGRPRDVLSFVERGRASALLLRPPRPPDDAELSRQLADLRTTMTEIEDRRGQGRPVADLVQRQVRAERAIADRCRRFPAVAGPNQTPIRRISELVDALGELALVEYIEFDDTLFAVTLVDNSCRLHRLGSVGPIRQGLTHLSFALRRTAAPTTGAASRTAAGLVLDQLGATFDEQLFGPLRAVIGARQLVIVPSRSLQALPWAVLPTCFDRPVSVVPSARLWLQAAERARPASQAVVVVAGPGLPGARSEALAVAAEHPGTTLLIDADAAAGRVLAAMDGAALAHVAAHGLLRSDNPFFSSLLLADGPLTVYELQALSRAPEHVVLAACEAATPRVISVDEVLGLAAAMLALGTASLVAPTMAVLDHATVDFMLGYHAELLAGRSPADALAQAQSKAAALGRATWAAAAGFLCIGAGHRRPSLTPA